MTVENHEQYERYLQSTVTVMPADYVDSSDPAISDILDRFNTLYETNQDLRKIVQQNTDAIEKSQAYMSDMAKSKSDQILVSNAQLAAAQKQLDRLKSHVINLEQRVEENNRSGAHKMRVMGEVKLAIENLYARSVAVKRASEQAFKAQQLHQAELALQQQQQDERQQSMQQQQQQQQQQDEDSPTDARSRRTSLTVSPQAGARRRPSDASKKLSLDESAATISTAATLSTPGQQLQRADSITTAVTQSSAAATKNKLTLAEKMHAIEEKVYYLANVKEKAQEFIAIDAAKKAEIAQFKNELMAAVNAEKQAKNRRDDRHNTLNMAKTRSTVATSSTHSSMSAISGASTKVLNE
jgi:hypothetical protein